MKIIRLFLFVIIMFIIPAYGFAKNVQDEVILTVSADGTTKEEAVKAALRSAIEQAYGTFVSANTTLLNDELVKDEIVTISSGNIKKYEEMSMVNLPNGRIFVTLRAVVCISKLINYAQNKGSETEFAGASFAANLKMKDLNKKNELIVWKNLLQQLQTLFLASFDYQLNVGAPRFPTKDDRYLVLHWSTEEKKNNYILSLDVQIKHNMNLRAAIDLLLSTALQISLTKQELKEYEASSIPYARYNLYLPWKNRKKDGTTFTTRNVDKIDEILKTICKFFNEGLTNFVVVDNLGGRLYGKEFRRGASVIKPKTYEGTGIIQTFLSNWHSSDKINQVIRSAGYTAAYNDERRDTFDWRLRGLSITNRFNMDIYTLEKIITKNDLDKYTNFEVKVNICNTDK